jgi:hypothetical protein
MDVYEKGEKIYREVYKPIKDAQVALNAMTVTGLVREPASYFGGLTIDEVAEMVSELKGVLQSIGVICDADNMEEYVG